MRRFRRLHVALSGRRHTYRTTVADIRPFVYICFVPLLIQDHCETVVATLMNFLRNSFELTLVFLRDLAKGHRTVLTLFFCQFVPSLRASRDHEMMGKNCTRKPVCLSVS